MNNIFQGANFGDKFLTRGGSIAILIIPKTYRVMLENATEYSVMSNGLVYDDMPTNCDIVSRYQEPIDEEKLDELAINFVTKGRNIPLSNQIGERVAFKAGFRSAVNNK